MSRPYVVKLLDEGKIPSRMVGKYRRVRFDDLMAYKQKDDEARAKVLDQLAVEAQELGMAIDGTPIITVYDANILYPAPLRDLFMRIAQTGLVQAKWTEAIHEEWIRMC